MNFFKLASFYWDPDKVLFTLPYFNHPVVWYGLCFALGFVLGYAIMIPIVSRRLNSKDRAFQFVDRMTWFVVVGTIVGARLGHVFFYEWPYYKNHPAEIVKIWEGGLASHGGTLGVLLAIFIYLKWNKQKYPEYSFIKLLDDIVIPTAVVACFIRIGNFFNQEILGTTTSLPWGVVFGHPADGSLPVARHPVQLYEAIVYLCTFFILLALWRTKKDLRPGFLSGLFFILVFGSRFLLEFLKMPLGMMIDESWLQTGQYLSIPMIVGGLLLMFYSSKQQKGT